VVVDVDVGDAGAVVVLSDGAVVPGPVVVVSGGTVVPGAVVVVSGGSVVGGGRVVGGNRMSIVTGGHISAAATGLAGVLTK
jgi:hypothetical protein